MKGGFGITEATIEEIKARTDIVELIEESGVQVKSAGSSKKACCPFHNEDTPSFVINERKGFYHCFGCGESGDVIKYVMKREGLAFVEAVKRLAERCGVKIEERADPVAGRRRRLVALLAELASFYHRCLLKSGEGELARNYLAGRALDGKLAEEYLIGYAPSGTANVLKWAQKHGYTAEELEAAGVIKAPTGPGDGGYHRFGGRLMFSIRDKRGEVVGFSGRQLVASKNSGKYVNSPETLVFKKANILYGFDRAAKFITQNPHHEAIVCEGQIDCIRLQSSGFPNSVAGQGTAFTESHAKMLRKVADELTLVYDDDTAGHKATVKTARLALAAGMSVRVVSLPGGDDPDSFLRTKGADEFKKLLAAAESVMSFQVRTERAKEERPDTIDATARVAGEVLATVASCSNEVMKAAMLAEAADLMKLPRAALQGELGKLRTSQPASRFAAAPAPEADAEDPEADELAALEAKYSGNVGQESPDAGVEAAKALPPPPREFAFMEFLMANEYDRTLDGMAGEFLPDRVFAHDFTRRFVGVWRAEVVKGEDEMQLFAVNLGDEEKRWFDRILLGSGKSQASGMSATDIMQDFVRSFWIEALKRQRGELPAVGDAQTDMERLRLTMALKRLASVRWNAVKEMIRNF